MHIYRDNSLHIFVCIMCKFVYIHNGVVDANIHLIFFSLKNYASRQTKLKDVDQSIVGELTTLEQHLLNSQQLMMVRGKVSTAFQHHCIVF